MPNNDFAIISTAFLHLISMHPAISLDRDQNMKVDLFVEIILQIQCNCLGILVLFRKYHPLSSMPMSLRLFPTFTPIRFSVSGFMLRSLIHLDLSFVHGDKYGSIFILLHKDCQLDRHHLLKMLFFPPLYVFGLLSKINCPQMCGFTSGSSILFH